MPDEIKIIGLLCNWCSYAAADLAGVLRKKYAQNVRLIRIPCSGRVNPHFILTALQQGASGVFVGGCHPGDCHYANGNYYAEKRFTVIKALLEFAGVEPDRIALEWISASEADKFADFINTFTLQVKRLPRFSNLVKTNLES